MAYTEKTVAGMIM